MKRTILGLFVWLAVMGLAAAADPHFRFLLHPTKQIDENGWGVAAWNVTNIGKEGSRNEVLIGGLRYQNHRFWTEFMPCVVLTADQSRPCFDTRTNVTLPGRMNIWFETQTFSDQFYWFAEVDYTADWGIVGIEGENVHAKGMNSLGIGPHVKFKLAEGIWIGPAYQFRRDEPDVLRLYLVIHLPR